MPGLINNHQVTRPSRKRQPILLSVPHCGTAFPPDVLKEFRTELIEHPDDTDWFVDKLYGFATDLGITMLTAAYSRWVIDLNRHPLSQPLYGDGRIITALCPTTTFLGDPLYKDARAQVEPEEVQRRIELYFDPYHATLANLLQELKDEFGQVLLWDCHSIRQIVPTIQPGRFPDLILGSADGNAADLRLVQIAYQALDNQGFTLQLNHPFKGGYITRHYGRPQEQQHALQLEMAKINYMDDSETRYDVTRAKKMEELLIRTLSDLGDHLIAK